MNKKIILETYKNNFWNIGTVKIYYNNNLSKSIKINKFHDVIDDYIIIYETNGGLGTGFRKGDILHKIKIDCDFETIELLQDPEYINI